MDELVDSLLRGSIDLHMHTSPDLFARSVTAVEAAAQAKQAGMAAIMIKSHHTLTADRAALTSSATGFRVFGGLALNSYVGGFNPDAVEAALRFGAKEIWMPTITSRHYLQGSRPVVHFASQLPENIAGLTIWDDNGEMIPELAAILEKIARYRAILGSGHLSIPETKSLVRTAREAGVERILITHPEGSFIGMSIEDMKELADMGALMEFHYAMLTHSLSNPTDPEFTAKAIKEVGPARCIMATDGGQVANPAPVEMMRRFMSLMLEAGITEVEIRRMTSENPRTVLGLDT